MEHSYSYAMHRFGDGIWVLFDCLAAAGCPKSKFIFDMLR